MPAGGVASREWLLGGGELGDLIRAKDWSSTPLGPRERWPQSLRTVVNLVVEGKLPMVLLWGPEWLMLYNDAVCALLADRHPRALGRPAPEIWPELWRSVEPGREAAMREDVPFLLDLRGHRQGAFFTVAGNPVRVEDGTAGGVLATLQETTTVEHSRQLRAILDNAALVMFLKDLQGRYLLINRRYEELFHITRTAVIGKTDEDIFPPEFARTYRDADRSALEAGRSIEVEEVVPQDDGIHRYISIKFPLYDLDGRPYAICGMATDITDRKQAEEQLQEADKRKNEFLAMLSHELRNPLAPIRNSLYVLGRAAPGGEQARRAQAIIERQVGHLSRLIDDLLDVTRITRGKVLLQRERLDLKQLVQRTVEDHRGAFVEGGIDLGVQEATVGVWVNGDRTRLAQVIGNLLQNAAKFTPRGGRTTVEVGTCCGHALVRVRDTGRGISPGMLPRVFDAFAQADTTIDRSKGGLGLGLALVKGLIELHGGSVSAESEGPGRGAIFELTLPLEPAQGDEPAPERSGARRPARRVLLIEDNADAAESLREAFAFGGHEVAVASRGPEGIVKAREFKPDVVLCDIGLPEMDGYAVARALRADPSFGRVRLVALTGYAGPEDITRSREAGFDAHLAKPPSIETLEQALEAGAGLHG